MLSPETRNTLAKILVVAWIAGLIALALSLAKTSASLDPNAFFGLSGENRLPAEGVLEVKVLVLMLSVSIVGGVSFMIKDFYRSVKYANLYDRAYEDYKAGSISLEGFQKLATVEIYSGRFNYTWVYWFLIQPLLSSALGIIAFFIARSGLGVIQGVGSTSEISIRSLYMYAVFTFLAGFSSHKFIAWLDRLADKIFSTTIPEQKAERRLDVESAAANDREALRSELASSVPAADAAPVSGLDPVPAPKKKSSEAKPPKEIR